MSSRLVVLIPLALLLPTALVVLLVLALTGRPDSEIGPATAAARRHAVAGGVLAVVAGVGAAAGVAALASSVGGLTSGRLLAVAVLVAGIAHTMVLALTEITWPRPTGARRTGRLARRDVREFAPRGLLVVAAAAAGLLVAVLLTGTAVADDDGRSVSRGYVLPDGALGGAGAGPFPGSFYSVPLLGVLLVLVVLVLLTLRLVVSRPAVAGADAATDTALRRASAHRVVRGAGAAATVTLGAVLVVGGQALHGLGPQGPAARTTTLLLLLAGGVVALAGIALLLVPARRVPAPPGAVVHPVPGGVPA